MIWIQALFEREKKTSFFEKWILKQAALVNCIIYIQQTYLTAVTSYTNKYRYITSMHRHIDLLYLCKLNAWSEWMQSGF